MAPTNTVSPLLGSSHGIRYHWIIFNMDHKESHQPDVMQGFLVPFATLNDRTEIGQEGREEDWLGASLHRKINMLTAVYNWLTSMVVKAKCRRYRNARKALLFNSARQLTAAWCRAAPLYNRISLICAQPHIFSHFSDTIPPHYPLPFYSSHIVPYHVTMAYLNNCMHAPYYINHIFPWLTLTNNMTLTGKKSGKTRVAMYVLSYASIIGNASGPVQFSPDPISP